MTSGYRTARQAPAEVSTEHGKCRYCRIGLAGVTSARSSGPATQTENRKRENQYDEISFLFATVIHSMPVTQGKSWPPYLINDTWAVVLQSGKPSCFFDRKIVCSSVGCHFSCCRCQSVIDMAVASKVPQSNAVIVHRSRPGSLLVSGRRRVT